jgi:N-acetylglucosaminyldiphosphoundecaprenol N-acetyl-beta-D-mannosaminyltransferase
MQFKKVEILGILFNKLTMKELINEINKEIKMGNKIKMAFSNAQFIINAYKSSFLFNYLNSVDYNLADGMAIVWCSNLLGKRLPERITGTDFTHEMASLSEKEKYTIFLLGGRPGIAELAAKKMVESHPGCIIVGTHHGYFSPIEEYSIIKKINDKNPDFLMVCLGNPKQEEWIARNFDLLNAKVIFGNGGALDFTSGRIPRAPLWMQKAGLEWFYRFIQEPRRMWRRYLLGNAAFLWLVFSRTIMYLKRKSFKRK